MYHLCQRTLENAILTLRLKRQFQKKKNYRELHGIRSNQESSRSKPDRPRYKIRGTQQKSMITCKAYGKQTNKNRVSSGPQPIESDLSTEISQIEMGLKDLYLIISQL